MSIIVKEQKRKDSIAEFYSHELQEKPRELAVGEDRGLFMVRVVDTTARNTWEIEVTGGFKFIGPESLYYINKIPYKSLNVQKIVDIVTGKIYDIYDAWGVHYRITFEPSANKHSTIQILGDAPKTIYETRIIKVTDD